MSTPQQHREPIWQVFLSYSRHDTAFARCTVDALEVQGWSVFWDREIPPGQHWSEFLLERIQRARCAIVLVSRTAIRSEWVRYEITEALKAGKLIPVRIDDSEAEAEVLVRDLQIADLSSWKPGRKDPQLDSVLAEVARRLGTSVEWTSETLPAGSASEGSIFVSYPHNERSTARTVVEEIGRNLDGLSCDPYEEGIGADLKAAVHLSTAIAPDLPGVRGCSVVLLIGGRRSLGERKVHQEIAAALAAGKPIIEVGLGWNSLLRSFDDPEGLEGYGSRSTRVELDTERDIDLVLSVAELKQRLVEHLAD